MRAELLASAIVVLLASGGAEAADKPTRFWNLTFNTISEFYLAPAGTENWSTDQTENEEDGTVEHDERMEVTGATSGEYDAKFTDVTGRTCIVKGVHVEVGKIFRIEETDLKDCKQA